MQQKAEDEAAGAESGAVFCTALPGDTCAAEDLSAALATCAITANADAHRSPGHTEQVRQRTLAM